MVSVRVKSCEKRRWLVMTRLTCHDFFRFFEHKLKLVFVETHRIMLRVPHLWFSYKLVAVERKRTTKCKAWH